MLAPLVMISIGNLALEARKIFQELHCYNLPSKATAMYVEEPVRFAIGSDSFESRKKTRFEPASVKAKL